MEIKPPSSIAVAVKAAGSAYRLAQALEISHVAVGKWVKRGYPPAERCLAIEAATGISRYALRPDVYGPEPETERAA